MQPTSFVEALCRASHSASLHRLGFVNQPGGPAELVPWQHPDPPGSWLAGLLALAGKGVPFWVRADPAAGPALVVASDGARFCALSLAPGQPDPLLWVIENGAVRSLPTAKEHWAASALLGDFPPRPNRAVRQP